MDDFLYGLIIGAVCGATAILVYGYMIERSKNVRRRDYLEFRRIQEEFDREYARYSNTPEYQAMSAKLKEKT